MVWTYGSLLVLLVNVAGFEAPVDHTKLTPICV